MNIFKYIFNLIYLPRCLLCGTVLKMVDEETFCEHCACVYEKQKVITVKYQGDSFVKNTDNLEFGYATFNYKDVKEGIKHFKFYSYKSYGKPLGEIMFKLIQRDFPHIFMAGDIITAVPISKRRFRQRGFNQSEILAREISRLSGIEYKNLLVRTKNTLPQMKLNKEERVKNIDKAFTPINTEHIKGNTIIIIDDIYTTGATLNECGKTLLKSQAETVIFYTLSARI